MNTVTVKTEELEGAALDWAVAKAAKIEITDGWSSLAIYVEGTNRGLVTDWRPSASWAQGGPLIEKYRVGIYEGAIWNGPGLPAEKWEWYAGAYQRPEYTSYFYEECYGETLLIAAMRAIVASELGDTVEIPEELVK